MKSLFLLVIIINLFYSSFANSNEIYVISKVNNQIITNADVNKEYRYLVALNPNLQNVEKTKVMELAKNSIIKEKIKEYELNKYFDLSIENRFITKIIANFYKKMGMENENEFENYLSEYNLNFEFVKKKINIETAWNDLVYKKFSNRIEIDEQKIKNKINKFILNRNEQNMYLISEILFTVENYKDLEKKYEMINKSILEIGFDNTANIYSISNSAKLGGKIGWVNESRLNEVIKKEIINLNINEHTKPITLPGGFLILKLNDKKKEEIKINFDQEFNKQISNEKDSQLQQFSEIYFKKIKKNSTISEK